MFSLDHFVQLTSHANTGKNAKTHAIRHNTNASVEVSKENIYYRYMYTQGGGEEAWGWGSWGLNSTGQNLHFLEQIGK